MSHGTPQDAGGHGLQVYPTDRVASPVVHQRDVLVVDAADLLARDDH